MERKQEYITLLEELEPTPPALEYTVQRAQQRRKRRRAGRIFGIPVVSLAGVFAAFVLLVNTSMPFAMACGNIPALKDLTAAVAFSPSLKAAVEHDYAQYIGQSQTKNGITFDLEYLILDAAQTHFFVKVTGPEYNDMYEVQATFQNADGTELERYGGAVMHSFAPGTLTNAISMYTSNDVFQFPEQLRMVCKVTGWGSKPRPGKAPEAVVGEECPEEEERSFDAEFTFTFPMDTTRLNDKISIPTGDWTNVDGQQLRFSLDSYPSHGRLSVEEHPDNTATLKSMEFYLEDERGRKYQNTSANGISALGTAFMCDTAYFQKPKHLSLHITQLVWLEHGREYVTIDLVQGAALDTLPDGVQVYTHRVGNGADIALSAPYLPDHPEMCYQIAAWDYIAPNGEKGTLTGSSTNTGGYLMWEGQGEPISLPKNCFSEQITLHDYPWETVKLGMQFSKCSLLKSPVTVELD